MTKVKNTCYSLWIWSCLFSLEQMWFFLNFIGEWFSQIFFFFFLQSIRSVSSVWHGWAQLPWNTFLLWLLGYHMLQVCLQSHWPLLNVSFDGSLSSQCLNSECPRAQFLDVLSRGCLVSPLMISSNLMSFNTWMPVCWQYSSIARFYIYLQTCISNLYIQVSTWHTHFKVS